MKGSAQYQGSGHLSVEDLHQPVEDRRPAPARTAERTVCAQDHVDFYAELAGPVREHLADL
ncbi:hypothetical protein ABZ667_36315 [Streptomyces lavendulae]|uniref:hypothetical protein n=1 Tax=Streptomyces lavendulae TaxID=1914 RepID=UPI0033E3273A